MKPRGSTSARGRLKQINKKEHMENRVVVKLRSPSDQRASVITKKQFNSQTSRQKETKLTRCGGSEYSCGLLRSSCEPLQTLPAPGLLAPCSLLRVSLLLAPCSGSPCSLLPAPGLLAPCSLTSASSLWAQLRSSLLYMGVMGGSIRVSSRIDPRIEKVNIWSL